MKKLETLPEDIYRLFDPEVDHEVSSENVEAFTRDLTDIVTRKLKKYETPDSPLRMSALGKPDRQMWFEAHPVPGTKEPMPMKAFLKFLYGDVIEALLLFLTKEAGHEVQREQEEIDVNGVKGHIDAIIDGVVVDVKSASPYGYKKFETKSVTEDDPFGYVDQLAGYANVLTPGEDAAWLAMDKVDGSICVSPLKKTVIEHHKPEERIEHLRKVIAQDTPPPLCYEPVPDGKSGNMRLPTPCSYCAHKYRCHPGLRTFIYSTGPRYLTKVEREPDVLEVEGLVVDENNS